MTLDASYYRQLLRWRIAGRKVVLAMGQAASLGPIVQTMRDLGAAEVFALPDGEGTGEAPAGCEYHVLGRASAGTLMEQIRAYESHLHALPAVAQQALDAFDTEGAALIFRTLFSSVQQIGGRPVYGARRPEWVALEDKVVIDVFWDRHGVRRAPSRVVAARELDLRHAAAELDDGDGTVWAGDARDGWHGGAELTRWVRTEDDAKNAASLLSKQCDRVRVMPFLEGIPCSVHGIVFPDYVVALRPVEMLTMRDPQSRMLRYLSCATGWDPPPRDRDAMRVVVREVGDALRSDVGFRGAFTIDGVMTASGFLPTELNPRFGAGLFALTRGVPDLPLYFICQALCAAEPWDFRARQLEAMLLAEVDAHRFIGCSARTSSRREQSERVLFVVDDRGDLRRALEGDTPDGSILIGPSPLGCTVRVSFDAQRTRIGPSVAPRVLAALQFSDRELGTNFGPLEVARDVRNST